MASTSFTLAALATMAVPGITVISAREHSYGDSDELVAAVIQTDRGELIVRVPRDATAERSQSAELLGLAALTVGARSMLPFEVPEVLGLTGAGQTRAVVYTYLSGEKVANEALAPDALIIGSVAAALRAIHSLPISLIADAGLPNYSAEACRENAARLVRRAHQTRLVPAAITSRWEQILDDDAIWAFEPTVIHGNIEQEQFLVENDHVVGLLGWSELSVDDPARDLAWSLAAGEATFESLLSRYDQERDITDLTSFAARVHFYHELEVAKWLLHGIDTHDKRVIDDAVLMFDVLMDRLPTAPRTTVEHQPLNVEQVEQLLDSTAVTKALETEGAAHTEATGQVLESTVTEYNQDDTATAPIAIVTDETHGSSETGEQRGL